MRTKHIRWSLAIIVALVFTTTAVPAWAQSTGGSFGGGSFGGSSGGSSSGGGSSGGGYSGSSGGSSGSSYSTSSGGGTGGGCSIPSGYVIGFVVLFAALMIYNASQPGGIAGARQRAAMAKTKLDVSAIQLGIDWRARKVVQSRLNELAQSGQTNSPEHLAELLRETVVLLQQARLAWLYARVSNHQPMTAPMAERAFRDLASGARAQFREELVRNADGTMTSRVTPEMKSRPDEGEGVVVITLIVAAKRAIIDSNPADGVAKLDALLEDLLAVANSNMLAVLEVVWSPAAENDRMSTAELEQNYPELTKIDAHAIAGRVFCAHCSGPFAMELLTCPHCGAPIPKTDAPAA